MNDFFKSQSICLRSVSDLKKSSSSLFKQKKLNFILKSALRVCYNMLDKEQEVDK